MADISKLNLNGVLYDIKDTAARTGLSNLEGSLGTAAQKDYATVAIGTTGESTDALPTVGQIETYVSNKVTGSMHYVGMFDVLPAATSYESGDVVIINIRDEEETVIGRKEYICTVFSGLKVWEELGDEEGLYATTMQLNAVKGAGWSNETVKGNADNITLLGTRTSTLENAVGDATSPAAGTIRARLNTIEGSTGYNITSTDVSNWNSKQNAITDGSATVARVSNEGIITLVAASQQNGALKDGPDIVNLAAIANTGAASDVTEDSSHRFVTDTEKQTWNSYTSYITSVDGNFNVTSGGKLEFASGKQAMTSAESTKLSGIAANATAVSVPVEKSGNITINGTSKQVVPDGVVSDINYKHITVANSSVTDGTSTFNKYTHPTGSAASQTSGFYKFSTDANSHVASVTAVDGNDISGLLNFITAYDATNNKIATAADIAGGVHFKGVYASFDDLDFTPANGDMIIIGSKEYIFSTNSSEGWVEIGDENAWDTKGSAAQALVDAEAYADGLITGLDSSISATSGYALTGVTIADGKLSAKTDAKIPTNNNELTNGADYATNTQVSNAIQNAIYGAIDTVYTASAA